MYGTILGTPQKDARVLFKKGDPMRVSRMKDTFEKGYEQSFTKEIFIIEKVVTRGEKLMYLLVDFYYEPIRGGGVLPGGATKSEQQKRQNVWDRENYIKICTTKKKKLILVKWRG